MNAKRVGMLLTVMLEVIAYAIRLHAQEVVLFSKQFPPLCPEPEPECQVSTVLRLTGINNQGLVAGYWFNETGPDDGLIGSVVGNLATKTLEDIRGPNHLMPGAFSGFVQVKKVGNVGGLMGYASSFKYDFETEKLTVIREGPVHGRYRRGQEQRVVWFSELNGMNLTSVIGNSKGDFAGHFYDKDGNGHSFILRRGRKVQFVEPFEILAVDITDLNDKGDVLGTFFDGERISGFIRQQNGVYTRLDFPGALYTYAHGFNNLGDVVGHYIITVFDPEFGIDRFKQFGFTFEDGVFVHVDQGGSETTLEDINDFRQVVGYGGGAESFVMLPSSPQIMSGEMVH